MMKKICSLIILCITWLSINAQWHKEYITDEFTNKKEVIMVHKTNSIIDAVWYENSNELKIMFYCDPNKAFNLTFNYCWHESTSLDTDEPILKDYNTDVLVNNSGSISECYLHVYYPKISGYSNTLWSEIYLNASYEDISHLKFISMKYYDKFFEETVVKNISFTGFTRAYKGIKPRKHSKKKRSK